jgi:multidrug efflux pump subunit AcrA (membrane-fusion protein)
MMQPIEIPGLDEVAADLTTLEAERARELALGLVAAGRARREAQAALDAAKARLAAAEGRERKARDDLHTAMATAQIERLEVPGGVVLFVIGSVVAPIAGTDVFTTRPSHVRLCLVDPPAQLPLEGRPG